MSKTTTTSSSDLSFWVRHIFAVCLVGVLYILVQPRLFPILEKVHKYLQENALMPWFGGLTCLIVLYLIFWIVLHRKIYLPSNHLPGLLLVGGLYFYYRVLSSSCDFWLIANGCWVAWMDFFVLPWFLTLYVCGQALCSQREDCNQRAVSCDISHAPIESAEEDELDFETKVGELVQELRDLNLKGQSICYGITAPWGYGKTSFLNLLSNELRADGIVVGFNPRSAKNGERIQEAFLVKLGQELSRYYRGASLIISRYTEQIGLLDHYSYSRPLADALRLFNSKGDKDAVNRAIEKIGKRLYVVLDDLDRLEGKELLETIKLIDITASFKNTVFLVACDKKYANAVLQEYLGVNPGQGYLDKYIAREIQLSGYINERLTGAMAEYIKGAIKDGELVTQEVVLLNWYSVAQYVVPHLGTLRQLKRYFQLFIKSFLRVQDYVDPADFFLLSLLQYKDNEVYNAVKYRICFADDEPFFSFYPANRWKWRCSFSADSLNSRLTDSIQRLYPQCLSEQLQPINQIAQWEGALGIVYMLFKGSKMVDEDSSLNSDLNLYGRRVNLSYSSIRYRRGFSSYFPDLEDEDRESWHNDLLSLVRCGDRGAVQRMLDRRYHEDRKALVRLFSNLIRVYLGPGRCMNIHSLIGYLRPGENRAITLELAAYVADRYDDGDLKEILSSRFHLIGEAYEDLGVVEKGKYKELIDEFLGHLEDNYPILLCELLNSIPNERKGREYIYTEQQVAEYLLKGLERCLSSFSDQDVARCRAVVNDLIEEESHFIFKQKASALFADWIIEHLDRSISLILVIERKSNSIYAAFIRGVSGMVMGGIPIDHWIDLFSDSRTREVLRVIALDPDYLVRCRDLDPNRQLGISYLYDLFLQKSLIAPHTGSI